MGAKKGAKVRIVKKNDDYSQDYQVGDVFTVEGTWYGGIHVTTPSGVPLSLDEEEYELADVEMGRPVDRYSYELGVMDCFCEMVAAGLKRLAMSHPCDTREERDSYREAVEALCRRYGVCFYGEDEAFLTDLFPEELNKGKYNYLFYRTEETLEAYLSLKKEQARMKEEGSYEGENRRRIAEEFGRLLSYPEEGIQRYIERTVGEGFTKNS